jgi:PadR family transcriptional regulator PadR
MAKGKGEFLQGTLDMLILKTISYRPMHGYGIALRIQQESDDILRVEEGALYPALYRLEHQGWIRSEWGVSDNNRRAKFYNITRTGRAHRDAESKSWERLSAAVSKVTLTEEGA